MKRVGALCISHHSVSTVRQHLEQLDDDVFDIQSDLGIAGGTDADEQDTVVMHEACTENVHLCVVVGTDEGYELLRGHESPRLPIAPTAENHTDALVNPADGLMRKQFTMTVKTLVLHVTLHLNHKRPKRGGVMDSLSWEAGMTEPR